ncbi:MAG: ABC transporter permease subunit [Actinomycetota bacterium]|nr:ABC transporter permease subunit [Actinomycetota bacterium]
MRSTAAELLILRKRVSTWILMGVWVLLGMMFSYLLPYLTYRGGGGGVTQTPLAAMLPESLADTLLGGFPFFGGVLALMLGVLAFGSDYGWNTLKTLLTQRSGRLRMFAAKVAALAVVLVPFVLTIFIAGAAASYFIAGAEGAAVNWPSAWEIARALAAGWFVLATWTSFGVLLAVMWRGTALAIGLGILYSLVIEGLVSALAGQVSWLNSLVEYFLRANAYSVVTAIGVPTEALTDNGPGSFFGPFVDGGQATLVLTAYITVCLLLSAVLLHRRDVH